MSKFFTALSLVIVKMKAYSSSLTDAKLLLTVTLGKVPIFRLLGRVINNLALVGIGLVVVNVNLNFVLAPSSLASGL